MACRYYFHTLARRHHRSFANELDVELPVRRKMKGLQVSAERRMMLVQIFEWRRFVVWKERRGSPTDQAIEARRCCPW